MTTRMEAKLPEMKTIIQPEDMADVAGTFSRVILIGNTLHMHGT